MTISVDYDDGSAYETFSPGSVTFTSNGNGHQATLTPHTYRYGGDYIVKLNMTNQVSEGSFTHSHRIIEHISNFALADIFTMEILQNESKCYGMEDDVTFKATLDRGTHMKVTWEFGDGTTRVS